ncbi:MAG: hypothetical protein NTY19_34085 [Planctomycetota bacterium]|nr:hypothetical protein [Planctomycetota bacterium]
MAQGAKITSTETVRLFKVAMQEYETQVRDTVTQLELELRRAVDWIEHDRLRYWTHESRAASDALAEARRALERVELAIRPEDKRSAYEKKLAFDHAKQRLRNAEQKSRAVRKWRLTIRQEADMFLGHLNRLTNYLDTEFPRAVATLERLAQALDKYTEFTGSGEGGAG